MTRHGSPTAGIIALAMATNLILLGNLALGQDMEPRSYANTPIHLNMVGLGYTHSWGSVLVDPSLPVEGLDTKLDLVTPLYVRTLPIFGWSSKLVMSWPYANLKGDGTLGGAPVSGERTGFADPRVRLNINFVGAPALNLREFQEYRQKTIVGATFEIQAPLGQYDTTKVVNLGANRWTFMTEAGLSRRIGRWTLEGTMGALFFTENDEYLGDQVLNQNPVTYTDIHAIFNFKPNLWMAFDMLWVWGGQSTLDGMQRADLQSNTRAGLTLSYPLARRHSLKLVYANGVTTRIGADFQTLGLTWVMNWGG